MLSRAALGRVVTMAIGVGAGPFVQLVATPWLARIYSPVNFGQLTLFSSFAGVLIAVSCLRYETTIAVVDDEFVATGVWVALTSALVLFLLANIALLTGLPQVWFPQFAALGSKIWGVPIAAFCGALALVGSQLSLRQGHYFKNATIRSKPRRQTVSSALIGWWHS